MYSIADPIQKLIESVKEASVLVNYPGSLFYVSHVATWSSISNIKIFGIAQPYMLLYCKNGVVHVETPFSLGLGEYIVDQFKKDPRAFMLRQKETCAHQKGIVERFLADHPADEFPNGLKESIATLNKSSEILVEAISWYNICFMVDRYFAEVRKVIFTKYNLSFSEDEIVMLSITQEQPAVLAHDSLISQFLEWISGAGYKDIQFDDVTTNPDAMNHLKKCYEYGYYQYSGYGGVKLWTMKEEFELVKMHERNPQALQTQLKQREENTKATKTLLARQELPEEVLFWIDTFMYFSWMRDERKVIEQKMFYWQAECLEKLAVILNTTRTDLELLTSTDINETVLKSETLSEICDLRREGWLWIWTEGKEYVWDGLDAQKTYLKYSIQAKKMSEHTERVKQFKGNVASKGFVQGKVRVVLNSFAVSEFDEGDILVTSMTTPEFVPLMKKAGAILTEHGGLTCHAAIVARELRKPCIIDIQMVTQLLKDGDQIEVDANKGIVRVLE